MADGIPEEIRRAAEKWAIEYWTDRIEPLRRKDLEEAYIEGFRRGWDAKAKQVLDSIRFSTG